MVNGSTTIVVASSVHHLLGHVMRSSDFCLSSQRIVCMLKLLNRNLSRFRLMSSLPFTRLKSETELAVLAVLRACRL